MVLLLGTEQRELSCREGNGLTPCGEMNCLEFRDNPLAWPFAGLAFRVDQNSIVDGG
jgi:hypothetical protein